VSPENHVSCVQISALDFWLGKKRLIICFVFKNNGYFEKVIMFDSLEIVV